MIHTELKYNIEFGEIVIIYIMIVIAIAIILGIRFPSQWFLFLEIFESNLIKNSLVLEHFFEVYPVLD